MEFNDIWEEIIKHSGEIFYTVRGLPFTYEYDSKANGIKPYRDGEWVQRTLSKANFEKALSFSNMSGQDFSNTIIGSSYVRAILQDTRIINK